MTGRVLNDKVRQRAAPAVFGVLAGLMAALVPLAPAGAATGSDIEEPLGPFKPDPVMFQAGVDAYDRGDYEEAFRMWLPMARGGDLGAMRNVGHLLRLGLGTERDLSRALFFYRRAAERGLAGAQANLALMLRDGEGTPPNPKEAARWFLLAAKAGHVLSAYEFARLLETGVGVEQNQDQAIAFYTVAATAGHEPARQRLAALGVELDPVSEGGEGQSAGAPLSPISTDAPEAAGTSKSGRPPPAPKPRPAEALPPLSLRGTVPFSPVLLNMPPDDTPVAPGGFAPGNGAPGPPGLDGP